MKKCDAKEDPKIEGLLDTERQKLERVDTMKLSDAEAGVIGTKTHYSSEQ